MIFIKELIVVLKELVIEIKKLRRLKEIELQIPRGTSNLYDDK